MILGTHLLYLLLLCHSLPGRIAAFIAVSILINTVGSNEYISPESLPYRSLSHRPTAEHTSTPRPTLASALPSLGNDIWDIFHACGTCSTFRTSAIRLGLANNTAGWWNLRGAKYHAEITINGSQTADGTSRKV